jgi:hypothetical protein
MMLGYAQVANLFITDGRKLLRNYITFYVIPCIDNDQFVIIPVPAFAIPTNCSEALCIIVQQSPLYTPVLHKEN